MDDGCGFIIGILILYGLGYLFVSYVIPFIILHYIFFSILGVILLGLLIFFINQNYIQPKLLEKEQRKIQNDKWFKWNHEPYAKLNEIYNALEKKNLPRKENVELKYNENLRKKNEYKSFYQSNVPIVKEGAKKVLNELNIAIERRESAIQIYKNSIEAIKFQKFRIEDIRKDFFSGNDIESAKSEFDDALEFGKKVADACKSTELDLKDLHLNNKYGADEQYKVNEDDLLNVLNRLELINKNPLLEDGNADSI